MTTTILIRPIALGIISDPPTIVLTYDNVSPERKRRKRKMPLRDFTDRSNVKRYAFNLRQRHNKFLAGVIDVTLEKMLRVIQEIQKGNSVQTSLKIVDKEYSVDPDEDLNVLTPAQLAQRKAVMEESFRKNLLRQGDPGYEYDKVVQFDTKVSDGTNDWDVEDDDNEKQKEVDVVSATIPSDIQLSSMAGCEIKLTSLEVAGTTPSKLGQNLKNDKLSESDMSCTVNQHDEKEQGQEHEEILITAESEPQGLKKEESKVEEKNTDVEDELANIEIETGVLESDEDEDFWQ